MRLAELVAASRRVAATRSRREKVDALADCLRRLGSDEIALGVAYLSGDTRQGRSGIGYALVRAALERMPGTAAPLTLAELDAALEAIARVSGQGSAAVRTRLLAELFARGADAERDFLVRLLLGELRQGALEGVMQEAIARAAGLPPASVRRAAMRAGSLPAVAEAALIGGEAALARFAIKPFQPVAPMLAQPAADVADALAKLGRAAFEWKLDGARVQVHRVGDDVRVYSRGLNDVSAAVPEVVEALRDQPARAMILDGEVIALRADGSPRPFQDTMRRFGRKLDAAALRRELPVSVFFFDCLWTEGEDLTGEAAHTRFDALAGCVTPQLIVPRLVTGERPAAEAFCADALARGHEGVMAKALDASYQAGSRGAGWLKVKQANTLDLVVIAAEWGSGRRAGWLSNLHLAARDTARGGFAMLGKTFKGLTDALLEWQTHALLARQVARLDHVVEVRPELVVEIAYNEIQASSQYASGLTLRFARVKRYREDKRVDEADTLETVRALFEAQRHRQDAGRKQKD